MSSDFGGITNWSIPSLIPSKIFHQSTFESLSVHFSIVPNMVFTRGVCNRSRVVMDREKAVFSAVWPDR